MVWAPPCFELVGLVDALFLVLWKEVEGLIPEQAGIFE